jgi:hypothetical protein
MPRRATHDVAGVFSGATYSAYRASGQPQLALLMEVVGGCIGGVAGSRLPDLLEPATSPRHRSSCHTASFGAGVVYIGKSVIPAWQEALRKWADELAVRRNGLEPDSIQAFAFLMAEMFCRFLAGALAGLFAGYVSHLVLDGCSPCSIQLI